MTHNQFQRMITETAFKYQIDEREIYNYLARLINNPIFPQSFERFTTGSTAPIETIIDNYKPKQN